MSYRFPLLKTMLRLVPGIHLSIFDSVYTRVAILKNRKTVSYIDIIEEEPGILYMAYGHTEPGFRRQGYISKLSVLIGTCAKLAGFKKVKYIAANVNKLVPEGNRPLSAHAGNKFKFSVNYTSKRTGAENRSLNLSTMRFRNILRHLKK